MDSVRQTFRDLVTHTPHRRSAGSCRGRSRMFDYRELCALLKRSRPTCRSRPPRSRASRSGDDASTPTAATCAPRWSSTGSAGDGCSARRRPDPAARGAPVTRAGGAPVRRRRRTSSCGSTAVTCARATRGASRPATRCASASARSIRAQGQGADGASWPKELGVEAVRYQGNWIPHRIRPAAEGDVFFAGDSAGHCLPMTAEGIRTALYFGLALRARAARACSRAVDAARRRWRATTRSPTSHRWKFEAMWHVAVAVQRHQPLGRARPR